MTMNVFEMVLFVKCLHADVCLVRKVHDSVSNNCPVLIFGSVCLFNSFTINIFDSDWF